MSTTTNNGRTYRHLDKAAKEVAGQSQGFEAGEASKYVDSSAIDQSARCMTPTKHTPTMHRF
jgi:hypothetical protein